MRIALLCAALLATACGGAAIPVTVAVSAPPTPSATASPAATLAPSPTPSPTPTSTAALVAAAPGAVGQGGAVPAVVLAATLRARITALVAASGGGAAVVVADGVSGETLHETLADETVFAASLYKLGVLLEAEHRIEAGKLSPTQRITITRADHRDGGDYSPVGSVLTIEQALERMITLSDNPSALAILRLFGTEAIHATLLREGIKGQFFTSRGSVTTARAVATLLGELARGTLVSAEASARMLARLSRQKVRDRIPAALPAGAVLGNKTGDLGFVTHDAGLVSGPGGAPVVLVVLTWDSGDAKGSQLIRDIAAAVYGGLAKP